MSSGSLFVFNDEYYYFININNPEVVGEYNAYKRENGIPYTHPLGNLARWEFEERYVKALKSKGIYIPPRVNFYFQPHIREKLRELDDSFRSGRMSWDMARFVFETEIHNFQQKQKNSGCR